jgi:anaerobic glycerol-3-phosphate dehydrogenase
MTPSEIVTIASETMQALSQATSGRVFMKSTAKFLNALSRVPDYPYAAFSSQEVVRLQQTAEQTIAAIELRIETGDDNGTVQLELARAIYELRRELEDVSRWRQHYLG